MRKLLLFMAIFALSFSFVCAKETTVTGLKTNISSDKATISDKITVSPAYGRKVKLYYKTDKWVKDSTYTLGNKKSAKVTLKYGDYWKKNYKTSWKIVIAAYKNYPKVTKTMTITNLSPITTTVTGIKDLSSQNTDSVLKETITARPARTRPVDIYYKDAKTGSFTKYSTVNTNANGVATIELNDYWKSYETTEYKVIMPQVAGNSANNLPALAKYEKVIKVTNKAATPVETTLTGLPAFTDPADPNSASSTITVKPAYGRYVLLYYYDTAQSKWIKDSTYTAANTETAKVTVKYGDYKNKAAQTKWKVVVPVTLYDYVNKKSAMKAISSETIFHNRAIDDVKTLNVSGMKKDISKDYSKSISDKVTISPAYGRTLEVQMYDIQSGKWIKKKSYTLEDKYETKVTIDYPKDWKAHYTSKWRLVAMDKAAKNGVKAMPKVNSATVELHNKIGSTATSIIMDAKTGEVIYEKDMYKKRSPASLSKMMTAILTTEKMSTSGKIKVTSAAQKHVASLYPGGDGYSYGSGVTLTRNDGIYSMYLPSNNLIATACGISVSGSISKFATLMNKKAKEIGCTSTTVYKNPSGLEGSKNASGNWSNAYDQALIGKYIMNKCSTVKTVASKSSKYISSTRRTVYNTNPILGEYGFVGLKTGTETLAGNCFCGATNYKSNTYITVVLGAYSKRNDTISLYNYLKYAK